MNMRRPSRTRLKARRILAALGLALVPAAIAVLPVASAHAAVDFEYHLACDEPILLGEPWTIDDTNSTIKYTNPWKAERPLRGQYLGTQHVTNYGGAKASFTAPTAPYVFAFGYTKPRNSGKAALFWNDQHIVTIDMYAPTEQSNCVVELYFGVPAGTFTVKALSQRNPASGGFYVNVDYIHYET